MIKRFLHYLIAPKPRSDDYHLKCATCGHEVSSISDLKCIDWNDGTSSSVCCNCYGSTIYYKKDYKDLKSLPIELKRAKTKDINMTKLLSAEQAKVLTKWSSNLKVINTSLEWLNEIIEVAANNGESKIEMSVELWNDKTNWNGVLFKQELNKKGYKFEDFYIVESSVMNPNIKFTVKKIRISW